MRFDRMKRLLNRGGRIDMKMQGVSWKGKHYVFAYEQETGSESAPDHKEIIICQMADYIEALKEALEPFAFFACDPPCGCHNCRAKALLAESV